MVQEFGTVLRAHSISLNPRKSHWFANGVAWEQFGRASHNLVLESTECVHEGGFKSEGRRTEDDDLVVDWS
eukprot:12423265-Karenia_brevis.AAC.1